MVNGKTMKYAGFWPRLIAAVIDGALSSITLGLYFLYALYTISKEGKTVGKSIMKLRIVKADGGTEIGLGGTIMREVVGKIVSSIVLGLGYLLIIVDEKKQGLHDKIANTYVISEA